MNQRYKVKSDTQGDYTKFLSSIPWDYFATFTTGYELTLPSARRAMERFSDRFNAKFGGLEMFWVAEKFECKDGYHTHALVSLKNRNLFGGEFTTETVDGSIVTVKTPPIAFDALKETWQIVTKADRKNYNRIQLKKYNSALGAGSYVSKYITKSKADYDYVKHL